MSKVTIGRLESDSGDLHLDVDVLMRTRMLVQAASGQGKSHWLRRLCEQLFGKVQIFIIDHEGEFSTLRPAFDFAVIGEGGDAPADVRSASLLAQKLLELHASAVFDLSESFRRHPRDRHTWVKNFLHSMMETPKRLWHPVVVIVDEAHKFAPEKDESEALEAMISLATDGRKRQFCAVFATQRLGKLSKDAASELLNVMIGGTVLDIDRKRAADALGVYGKELQPFNDQIKTIERGNFWCLGPAICTERNLVHVGDTSTKPPKSGSLAALEPPPPTAKIKALLPQLSDLPKMADAKAKTEAELRSEIANLKRQISCRPVGTPSAQDSKIVEKANRAVQDAAEARKATVTIHGQLKSLSARGNRLAQALGELARSAAAAFGSEVPELPKRCPMLPMPKIIPSVNASFGIANRQEKVRNKVQDKSIGASNGNGSLSVYGTPKKMLQAIAEFEAIGVPEPTRGMVASWCGIKSNTGTFSTYISTLNSPGFISIKDDRISLTEEGRSLVDPVDSAVTTDELLGRAAGLFGKTPAAMLRIIYRWHPNNVSRESIGGELGISHTSGTFSTYVSELRSAGMIEGGPEKTLRCADWLIIS